jgi:CheY-like chemotaxis protein
MFKILIAEQEVAVLREISTCLANGKFQIDEAVDGLRAHKLVARNSYDGIIMDRSSVGNFR